jgi:hypothetical protein
VTLTRTSFQSTTFPATTVYVIVNGDQNDGDIPAVRYRRSRNVAEGAFQGALTDASGAKWIIDEPDIFPEWFGAKGDAIQLLDGQTIAGSTTFTSASASFQASDVGKYIMIGLAGPTGRQLTATIASVTNATTVVLNVSATSSRTNVPWLYGTPDDAALQAMLTFAAQTRTRAVFTAGKTFLVRGHLTTEPPLRYRDNTTIVFRGDVLHANANSGGFVLCDQYFRVNATNYTRNVAIRFEGGSIIFPDAWTSDAGGLAKKGFGVTCTDGFEVWVPRLVGNNVNSFTTQVFRSKNGNWFGARMDAGDGNGEDGIHLLGNCSDITFNGVLVESGDDAFSLTAEVDSGGGGSDSFNAVIERITLSNSLLYVNGYSGVKILTNTTT